MVIFFFVVGVASLMRMWFGWVACLVMCMWFRAPCVCCGCGLVSNAQVAWGCDPFVEGIVSLVIHMILGCSFVESGSAKWCMVWQHWGQVCCRCGLKVVWLWWRRSQTNAKRKGWGEVSFFYQSALFSHTAVSQWCGFHTSLPPPGTIKCVPVVM